MTAVLGWARMLKLGLSESETLEALDAIEKSAEIQAQIKAARVVGQVTVARADARSR